MPKGIEIVRQKPFLIQYSGVITVPNRFRTLHGLELGSPLFQYITKDGDLLLSVHNYTADGSLMRSCHE